MGKIAEHVKNGEGALYNVGDTKEIELSGDYAGTYTVRLVNTSTLSQCNGSDFSETACGFVVEFQDVITKEKMNATVTNKGGWPETELYQKLNPNSGDTTNSVIYNALPEDLKQVIIDTKVISSHGSQDSSNFISTDKLYLLSTKEVWGNDDMTEIIGSDTSDDFTRQLDYYKNENVTTGNYVGAIKNFQETKSAWWLRSANEIYNSAFHAVNSTGQWGGDVNMISSFSFGVAPAFRVG